MLLKSKLIATVAVAVALSAPAFAKAQKTTAPATSAMPNLAGTYKCTPQPDACKWPGPTIEISQTGAKLELKSDNKEFAGATLTSAKTLSATPPLNADGLILPDHSIEWSNGTKWRKQ